METRPASTEEHAKWQSRPANKVDRDDAALKEAEALLPTLNDAMKNSDNGCAVLEFSPDEFSQRSDTLATNIRNIFHDKYGIHVGITREYFKDGKLVKGFHRASFVDTVKFTIGPSK